MKLIKTYKGTLDIAPSIIVLAYSDRVHLFTPGGKWVCTRINAIELHQMITSGRVYAINSDI